jgi:hypothetical protein
MAELSVLLLFFGFVFTQTARLSLDGVTLFMI